MAAAAVIIAAYFVAMRFFSAFNSKPGGIMVYWKESFSGGDDVIEETKLTRSGGFLVSKGYIVSSGGAKQLRFRIMGAEVKNISNVNATVGDTDISARAGLVQQKIMGVSCIEVFVGLKEPDSKGIFGKVEVILFDGDDEVGRIFAEIPS